VDDVAGVEVLQAQDELFRVRGYNLRLVKVLKRLLRGLNRFYLNFIRNPVNPFFPQRFRGKGYRGASPRS